MANAKAARVVLDEALSKSKLNVMSFQTKFEKVEALAKESNLKISQSEAEKMTLQHELKKANVYRKECHKLQWELDDAKLRS